MRKYKVHFTGGEGINWALDHDIQHLTRLSRDFVEVVPLEKAEIIHSVYWGALLTIPEKHLKRCTVITSIADKPQIIISRPEYLKVRERVDVWLCEYYESLNFISNGRLRCMLFPDPIDLGQFAPPVDRSATVKALKEKYGIPHERFVIGNFHRDSLGGNLDRPKKQKGADVFLEVADVLVRKGLPVHFLLAGPRRHWVRNQMKKRGIPYTFVGDELDHDDIKENTLNLDQVAELYRGIDAYVIASRWEGAPNSVLECSASKTPVVSTAVGQSPDILFREQIYSNALEGAELLERAIHTDFLDSKTDACFEHLHKFNSDSAIAGRLKTIYQQALRAPTPDLVEPKPSKSWFGTLFSSQSTAKETQPRNQLIEQRIRGKKVLTFALWNDFRPPPYGGGNQFMIALEGALLRKGHRVVRNTGKGADAHVIQSVWFDREKFDAEQESGAVVIHRVDGPIQLYRGNDFQSDPLCWEINREIADVTVMQSSWSMDQTYNLGYNPKNPVLMWNSCDPDIFHSRQDAAPREGEKLRIISTAWSNNPRKGKETYKWLDQNLDFSKYSYTFVGRIDEAFENIQVVEPVDSTTLANYLREHHVFLTASQRDPCSNSLVEALACGLPAVYLEDGGHPELVQYGGIGFTEREQIPDALSKIAQWYSAFANPIWVDHIDDLAQKYVDCVRYAALI
jgi:glycosyltransferase involved in cell wall biosynthesis